MKVAAEEANIPLHTGCFEHTLNLASRKAIDLQKASDILSKIRAVVSFVHKSTIATATLHQKQKLLQLVKLVIDVKKR